MGMLVQMYMYGVGKLDSLHHTLPVGFYASFVFVVISYVVMNMWPRMKQHKIVFVANALLLSMAHLHKMVYYYGFWGAEVT